MGTHRPTILDRLLRDEEGASLIEYVLLCVLIGVAAIAGISFLGQTSSNRMNNLGTVVEST